MPRRSYRRRTTRRPRRSYRKSRGSRRSYRKRSTGNKIFSFKRKFEAAPISVGTGVAVSAVYSISLGNVPTSTDFTNLFDMYRIKALKVTITPNVSVNNAAANDRWNLFSVLDYNDLSTITVAQAEQYENCKRTINTRTHVRFFKPKVAITEADVSGTSFIASYSPPWISCANTNIAHGFMKVISDVNPNGAAATFRVDVVVYMQFKNVN